MGSLCWILGRHHEAVGHFEDGLALCRRGGYRPEIAWICLDYASAIAARGSPGDAERAERLFQEGLELCRELGMTIRMV